MRAALAASPRTVVLTGAGVSAVRGEWARAVNTPWVVAAATASDIDRAGHPLLGQPGTPGHSAQLDALWRHGGALRQAGLGVQPTAAHQALARLEAALRPDQDFLLLTQTVDGLHQRAGSQRVVELHGSLRGTRCCHPACRLPPFADDRGYPGGAPRCPACGGLLRPDVVLAGEAPPVDATWQAQRALREASLLVAIGTGGQDAWALQAARLARAAGARTVFIDSQAVTLPDAAVDTWHLGPIDTLVPALLG